MKKITRKQFLLSLIGAGVSALGYARFVEPRWLEETRKRIPLSVNLRKPLRILHLSDFHASSVVPFSLIEHAIDVGLSYSPDVVCVTGDFITSKMPKSRRYQRILRRLSDAAPTLACLGNHDGGDWAKRRGGYRDTTKVEKLLSRSGIKCLMNESTGLKIGENILHLVGLNDWWGGKMQASAAFAQKEKIMKNSRQAAEEEAAEITVVLSHNPDTKKFIAGSDWDLLLCGHTHGGQIRIPLVGAPFAPVEDKRFVEGLHYWHERWLHISRGVGNVHGIRVNCRPEINVLDLVEDKA